MYCVYFVYVAGCIYTMSFMHGCLDMAQTVPSRCGSTDLADYYPATARFRNNCLVCPGTRDSLQFGPFENVSDCKCPGREMVCLIAQHAKHGIHAAALSQLVSC